MMFSDTTGGQGIIQDITSITGATVTEYTLADRTRDINNAYSKVAHLIIHSNGIMQWDDNNFTDQPISETSLVSGQSDYNIFAASPDSVKDWLRIEKVEIKDSNGDYVLIQPFDKRDLGIALPEFFETNGTPIYYDFNGTSVLLKPAPDYNMASGLRIYFQRSPSYFVSTDTTKTPGFATIFHGYLSLAPSYKYARDKGLPNRESLKRDVLEMEADIKKFYSKRAGFSKPVLRRKEQSYV